jgi:hypothetical protein
LLTNGSKSYVFLARAKQYTFAQETIEGDRRPPAIPVREGYTRVPRKIMKIYLEALIHEKRKTPPAIEII